MKIVFTLILSVITHLALGQFALVQDKDGFCHVRSAAEKGNNIIDKLYNGHIVYCFPNNGNWIAIDYSHNNKERNGQLYKDRVKFVSDYPAVPVFKNGNAGITLKKDSITVIVTEQKFERSRHRFSYYKEAPSQLERIDNKQYWGTDGGMPTREYGSIEVRIGSRKIRLPQKALENLYEPNLYATQANYDKANDILYIQSLNSDGAGGYEVIWKIEKGIYKDRFIAYGF